MNAKLQEKRKAEVIDFIVKHVNMIDKSGEAGERYQKYLTAMSLSDFHAYMTDLKEGNDILYVNVPNLKKRHVTLENNLKVAKEIGVEFFQRLKIVDPISGKTHLTPRKYLILHLPVRRQIQTIKSGLSYAVDNSKIDPSTGQVVGDSRSAALSTPEALILYSKGMNKAITELVKVRGGDVQAQRWAYRSMYETGSFTIQGAQELGTRAVSSETLSTYLKAMHVDNNI